MASSIPKEVKKEVLDGWKNTEVWNVALFPNTSNCLTQSLYASCTNQLPTLNGYTVGGQVVAGINTNVADVENAMLDATDNAWPASTFTARYAIVYETTGGKIRARYDFLADKSVTGGTFTIQWNVGGLIKIS